jgi:hypothetical protein
VIDAILEEDKQRPAKPEFFADFVAKRREM